MAIGDEDDDDEVVDEEQQEEGKKKLPLKLIIIVAVVVLIGGGAGAFFMMGDKGDETVVAEKAATAETEEGDAKASTADEAIYFSLDPPFVVNFTGKSRARFLQVSIQGLTRENKVKENVTKHFPQIRNNLVLLLSSKTYDELSTQEGKVALRKQVLSEIQKVLENETGHEGVEDVFFTSFVMQ